MAPSGRSRDDRRRLDESGRPHARRGPLCAAPTDAAAADRVAVALNAGDAPVDVRWPDARADCVWRSLHRHVAGGGTARPRALAPRRIARPSPRARWSSSSRNADRTPRRRTRGRRAGGARPARRGRRNRRRMVGRGGRAPRRRRGYQARAARGDGADGATRPPTRAPASSSSPTARERRDAAAVVVGARGLAGRASPSRSASRGGRRRAALRLRHEDGTERLLPCAVDDLPRERRDGRRRAHASRSGCSRCRCCRSATTRCGFDDDPAGTCRVVVAPDRCFLPPDLRARRAPLRPRRAPVRAAPARRPGHRRFHDAVARWPRPPPARAAASSASIRCTRSSPATANARVPIIRPTAAFSIRSTSTSSACPISRHRDDARALLARSGAASRRSRRAPPSTTRPSGSVKAAVLEACFARFEQRGDDDPLRCRVRSLRRRRRARRCGSSRCSRRSPPRIRASPGTAGRTACAGPTARTSPTSRAATRAGVRFALYLQWLADRQLAAAAATRAGERARARILSRSRGRRRAGRRRSLGESAPHSRAACRSARRPIRSPPPARTGTCRHRFPRRSTASACAGFRELVAANMRHAGALRIDHVMGLVAAVLDSRRRHGRPTAPTSTIRSTTLLGVLALESGRARCLVVGEDLGTVPGGLPRAARRRGRALVPRAVVRARRRRLRRPVPLSRQGGRVRLDARPADGRRAGGTAPTSPRSTRSAC